MRLCWAWVCRRDAAPGALTLSRLQSRWFARGLLLELASIVGGKVRSRLAEAERLRRLRTYADCSSVGWLLEVEGVLPPPPPPLPLRPRLPTLSRLLRCCMRAACWLAAWCWRRTSSVEAPPKLPPAPFSRRVPTLSRLARGATTTTSLLAERLTEGAAEVIFEVGLLPPLPPLPPSLPPSLAARTVSS